MGTWGTGEFENDAALDCMAVIVDGGGLPAINQLLESVLGMGGDFLEAPDAECALALAEMVASLAGRPAEGADVPPDVTQWFATTDEVPTPALVAKTNLVARRGVTEPSELLDLWQDAAEFAIWRASVDDLIGRL